MYGIINDLRKRISYEKLKYPLNIFDVCSKLENIEIKKIPFKTNGLRGMAVLADDESDINCILVNSNLSYEEQNFYVSHELIHIFTSEPQSGQTFSCYEKVQPFQDKYKEWLANEGAAELLVPYCEFLPLVKKHYFNIINNKSTLEFCRRVSKKFDVTPFVIQNRLNSLAFEINQYVQSEVDLDKIRIMSKLQQEREGIFIQSLNELEKKEKNIPMDIIDIFFNNSVSYPIFT